VDKYELVERYEALGDEDDFRAARRLFEQDLTGRSSALDRRQYGYLLESHGRRTLRRAVDQYEQAMSLDPDQDKVQHQWMHAKAALGEPRGGQGRPGRPGGSTRRLAPRARARSGRLRPGVYMSAFLLEQEGRLAEAAAAWRHILEYAEAHDWELTAMWPRQMLERLEKLLEERQHPGR